jgi:hypothetical protein
VIGQEFKDVAEVIVLVRRHDGSQHAFQVEAGTVKWESTGFAQSRTLGDGAAGRVTVEGRFHRKNRDQLDPIVQGEIGK